MRSPIASPARSPTTPISSGPRAPTSLQRASVFTVSNPGRVRRRRPAEREPRAAGRVLLVVMMEAPTISASNPGAEELRGWPTSSEHGDADAVVRGDDRGVPPATRRSSRSSSGVKPVVPMTSPAPARGGLRVRERRRRDGEVDHDPVGPADRRERVRHEARRSRRRRRAPPVLPDRRVPRAIRSHRRRRVGRLGREPDDHPAHAAGGAADDHVDHPRESLLAGACARAWRGSSR